MAIIYLTIDQAIELHDAVLTEGGLAGIRSHQGLASSIAQAEQDVFGQALYPTLADKASAYGFFLTANHPFNDGNKRTAAAVMALMLDLNGYVLDVDDDAPADTLVAVASGSLGSGLTPWS